jgi:hypothetical protein
MCLMNSNIVVSNGNVINENIASKKAAERYGFTFEGIWRQHMVQNDANRDTAWFSMLDKEWPTLKNAYEDWLKVENFREDHQQIQTLQNFKDLHNC